MSRLLLSLVRALLSCLSKWKALILADAESEHTIELYLVNVFVLLVYLLTTSTVLLLHYH
jgi:hypothetical protein